MMSSKRETETRGRGDAAGRRRRRGSLIFVIYLSLVGFACRGGAGETSVNQAEPPPAPSTPEKKVDDFQDNLDSVQRAGFDFIYGFRRPDGGVFTSEDKKYLKDNSPPETNQWRLTEDEKGVVAGSNYKFFPQNLEALRKRFVVEDYSKPSDESAAENSNGESVNRNSNGVKK